MSFQKLFAYTLLLVCTGLTGCAVSGGQADTPRHDNTDAVVWMQASAEYAAAAAGIYAAATNSLVDVAEAAAGPVDQMAIVLDIDETVLDNSRYQGQLVVDDESYDGASWDDWLALRTAPAVPGVVAFLRNARSLGFHIAFITNRPCRSRPGISHPCPQKYDTIKNLQRVGIDTQSTTLFLKGERPPGACRRFLTRAEQPDGSWSSDKTSRRQCVALDYQIIMLFGDQLGDFVELPGSGSAAAQRDAALQSDNWGRSWFMLPNPTYGAWRPRTPAAKRELIQGY